VGAPQHNDAFLSLLDIAEAAMPPRAKRPRQDEEESDADLATPTDPVQMQQ